MRTGIGVAAICFYGILWAEGANDVLADRSHIPLYTITWIARVAVFVGRSARTSSRNGSASACSARTREDAAHGVEIGIIRQLPDGEFIEEDRPLTEEERAVLESKKVLALLPGARQPRTRTACPRPPRAACSAGPAAVANRAFAETIPVEADGHGNGHHGNGHEVTGEEHEAVGAAGSAALPPGEGGEE